MISNLVPAVLAGGSGSRLWPLSRSLFPKQFHALTSEQTLLQETLLRAARLTEQAPVLVCNEEHRFIVAEQARAVAAPWEQILLEPAGRNTAPAIGLAAQAALQAGDDATLLLVLPSDHLVQDPEAFVAAVEAGVAAARDGALVTFGIDPAHPETGYGYIEVDAAPQRMNQEALAVRSFKEKPERAVAEGYLAAGNYLWNSGIFLFLASAYLEELAALAPAMRSAVDAAMANGSSDLDFFRPGDAFLQAPSDSIDYAVMEKTQRSRVVVPASFGWSDVGSWAAMWDVAERDDAGNHGRGDVLMHDTRNSYVFAQDRLVATLGLEDTVVVETRDAVLVAARDQVQGVKHLVDALAQDQRSEREMHTEVYRPWGSYEGVEAQERYQVKRICVKPGASLSLQMHHHRAEHWIVVRGTAEITKGKEVFLLTENQSTYIPLGEVHRLRNPGKVMLELIEVQVGAYLGEDDIVRFEDNYGRGTGAGRGIEGENMDG